MHVEVYERSIFHYGELSLFGPLPRPVWLYEGDTLSVSLCPMDWFKKATSKAPHTALYALERSDGKEATFIDLSRLSELNKAVVDDWANSHRLGSVTSPDQKAIAKFNNANDVSTCRDALLITWAKSLSVDGVWFSEEISANMPQTSRGGIFQHKLASFNARQVAGAYPSGWPSTRMPAIRLM